MFDLAAKIRGLTGFALDGQVLADFDREPAPAVNRNARIREQDVDLGERIAGVEPHFGIAALEVWTEGVADHTPRQLAGRLALELRLDLLHSAGPSFVASCSLVTEPSMRRANAGSF